MADLIPKSKSWANQFHLGRVDGPASRDLPACAVIGRWRLSCHQSLPTRRILDASGRQIGLLLGRAIDPAAKTPIIGDRTIDWPSDAPGREAAVERGLYALGGAWAALIADGDFERLYLDADGMLSAVYDPKARAAASTAGLLLDDAAYAARFRSSLYQRLDVAGEGWFPSALTAHEGIDRLLCNHYLDLATFEARRHWPVALFTHKGDVAASAEKTIAIVRRSAEALLGKGRCAVALTGGNETRFLLAAYRPFIKDLSFVTVSAPSTQRDVFLAKTLAERFGLRHEILVARTASEDEQKAWRYATGNTVTGPNMVSHPTVRPLTERFDHFLGGLGGEIGRAFFWRETDRPDTALSAAELTPRFGMPEAPEVTDATARWLKGVERFDTLTRLDLAYLELRMSAWSAAQTYAQSFLDHEHPLVCRAVYALMLDLPPEAKRGNLLIKSAIAQAWPELGEIPINRYGDWRDQLETLRKASDLKRVAKKMRKLWG